MIDFRPDEAFAHRLDEEDPLKEYRGQYRVPVREDGTEVIYFAGNSLGLQPRGAGAVIEQELNDWAALGVDAHFDGATPWYSYHEVFTEKGARLVGTVPGEVVMMNSLTVNLHLMMMTFYRPTTQRHKILVDGPTFPSDTYAIKSQIRHHGYDPADAFLLMEPREGEHTIREADVEETLARQGEQIALVMFAGVNFLTGQAYDLERIARAARAQGCVVGFDLAHAAGNVPLSLHDWDVDFAAWCSYKYLNAGPGAVAGCFVHERHGKNADLPRLAGWWGNDPATRFKMHLLPEFTPRAGADGWQLSNPPILAMAPLVSSLDLFDRVGMSGLRAKSEKLTAYLLYLIDQMPDRRYEVITPREAASRGSQLSILVHQGAVNLFKELEAANVVGDIRQPNVIRVAPVPMYNTFHEVWRFSRILSEV